MKELSVEYLDKTIDKLKADLTREADRRTGHILQQVDERADKLAQGVAKGFEHVDARFERLHAKIDLVDQTLEVIEIDLDVRSTVYSLDKRVTKLEQHKPALAPKP